MMFDGKKRYNIVGIGGASPTRNEECEIPVLLGDSRDALTPSTIIIIKGSI